MVKGSINPPSPTPVTKYNISVSVTDGTDPLENVSVALADADSNEYTGKTGSAGGCTISNVPEGSYNVTASKAGYDEYSGTLHVSKNDNLTITMIKE